MDTTNRGLPPGWKQGYRENGLAFADVFFHSEARSPITNAWLHTAETVDQAWAIYETERNGGGR